jgi:hypothetical protein
LIPREEAKKRQKEEEYYRFLGPAWKGKGEALGVSCFKQKVCLFNCLMVFNATFNNISVISWRSVLLVEETGGH